MVGKRGIAGELSMICAIIVASWGHHQQSRKTTSDYQEQRNSDHWKGSYDAKAEK